VRTPDWNDEVSVEFEQTIPLHARKPLHLVDRQCGSAAVSMTTFAGPKAKLVGCNDVQARPQVRNGLETGSRCSSSISPVVLADRPSATHARARKGRRSLAAGRSEVEAAVGARYAPELAVLQGPVMHVRLA